MKSLAIKKERLSIILLSYQSEESIKPVFNKVNETMIQEGIDFEFIIVDDGSTDNSYQEAKDLQHKNTNVRAYRLSKNYTSPYSQFAGYSLANGDCVVAITDDLQKPVTVVVQMYRAWANGAKVVISHRSSRADGFFSDLFSRFYYKFMNRFSDVSFPYGGSDSALIDREVYQLINNKVGKNNTTPTIEVLRLGFKPVLIPYNRQPAAGKSRWTLRKKLKLATDTFFSSSSFPIKAITWLGLSIFIFSIITALTILYLKVFSDSSLFGLPIPGWATIVVLISVFNGLILLCLGIVAQYIWRIYEDVRGKLPYVIMNDDEVHNDL
jgi:dolichol-phosphate mannosyltransferase